VSDAIRSDEVRTSSCPELLVNPKISNSGSVRVTTSLGGTTIVV
jgi:hypothetical protein